MASNQQGSGAPLLEDTAIEVDSVVLEQQEVPWSNCSATNVAVVAQGGDGAQPDGLLSNRSRKDPWILLTPFLLQGHARPELQPWVEAEPSKKGPSCGAERNG